MLFILYVPILFLSCSVFLTVPVLPHCRRLWSANWTCQNANDFVASQFLSNTIGYGSNTSTWMLHVVLCVWSLQISRVLFDQMTCIKGLCGHGVLFEGFRSPPFSGDLIRKLTKLCSRGKFNLFSSQLEICSDDYFWIYFPGSAVRYKCWSPFKNKQSELSSKFFSSVTMKLPTLPHRRIEHWRL